jgi:predicted nucleic acid-binding protein
VKLAVDSSAFAKRYVLEAGSERLDELLQGASQLTVSVILLPEVLSGLNRRLRERCIVQEEYNWAKSQLIEDIEDAEVLPITREVLSIAISLLETNVLRAMDALHIATAVHRRADLFVTADRRQYEAAKQHGLRSELLGSVV